MVFTGNFIVFRLFSSEKEECKKYKSVRPFVLAVKKVLNHGFHGATRRTYGVSGSVEKNYQSVISHTLNNL
jgi:hypothetical protein